MHTVRVKKCVITIGKLEKTVSPEFEWRCWNSKLTSLSIVITHFLTLTVFGHWNADRLVHRNGNRLVHEPGDGSDHRNRDGPETESLRTPLEAENRV